jgi:CelD/BcsL family acetyltransferase involved in cellulose biosynthesis
MAQWFEEMKTQMDILAEIARMPELPLQEHMPGRIAEGMYRAQILPDLKHFLHARAQMDGGGHSTIFQHSSSLRSWYESYGRRRNVRAFFIRVSLTRNDKCAMLLPFIMRGVMGARIIEFADMGVCDYNAPIMADWLGEDEETGRLLWRAILSALPPADLLRLRKMPREINGHVNPLIHDKRIVKCQYFGQRIDTGGDWESHIRKVNPKFAKDNRRRYRRLAEFGPIHLEEAGSKSVIDGWRAEFEVMQKKRLEKRGRRHELDNPAYGNYYRLLAHEGLEKGRVRLFRLLAGGETVAMLYGVCQGRRMAIVRITHEDDKYAKASPGRLIIIEAIKHMERMGYRVFDLTIGEYGFKRLFRPQKYELVSMVAPLSKVGGAIYTLARVKSYLRRKGRKTLKALKGGMGGMDGMRG